MYTGILWAFRPVYFGLFTHYRDFQSPLVCTIPDEGTKAKMVLADDKKRKQWNYLPRLCLTCGVFPTTTILVVNDFFGEEGIHTATSTVVIQERGLNPISVASELLN